MTKGLLTTETTGMQDLLKELEGMSGLIDDAVAEGTRQRAIQSKKDVQQSYLQLKGATKGDYVYVSLDYSYKTYPDGSAWYSAGSYEYTTEVGDIRTQFGKSNKDMLPTQIAYWLEHGTQRLKSGAAKPRKQSWSDVEAVEKRQHIAPKPFISRASVVGMADQEAAFAEGFNKIIEEG